MDVWYHYLITEFLSLIRISDIDSFEWIWSTVQNYVVGFLSVTVD